MQHGEKPMRRITATAILLATMPAIAEDKTISEEICSAMLLEQVRALGKTRAHLRQAEGIEEIRQAAEAQKAALELMKLTTIEMC